jgi:hypothetical protein
LACGLSSAKAAPLTLLDSRGWEMVSPVEKNGGEVQGFGGNFGGDVLQAAADGESVTFGSASSFGGEAQGAPVVSQYLARRGAGGWLTEDITLPTVSGAYGENPAGVPYRLFSPDLARALILNGRRCGGSAPCPRGYSLRVSAGGALTLSPEEPDLRLVGASPDLRNVIFSTCRVLTPDATEAVEEGGCNPTLPNLYEWDGMELRLLNILPGDTHGTPGASLAAEAAGAVSSDGSRVYFYDEGLFLREGDTTYAVSTNPDARFEAAVRDSELALYIEQCSVGPGNCLDRFEPGRIQPAILTPAVAVVGPSDDENRIYYVAPDGSLRRYAGTFGEEIAGAVDPSNYPPATGTSRVSPDGTHLAFVSSAPLTGYDNTDQNTGEPDSEVFLYDATANGGTGELICASCNAEGVAPIGSSTIPGAIANGEGLYGTQAYKPRVLTSSGRRLFFDSRDALATQDTNNDRDVYEWEAQGTGNCVQAGGCVQLISSGRSEDGASFVDASEDGRDAFFLTDASLVPSDPGAVDLYDAREGGGFPEPTSPLPCDGDACQPIPSPPEDPTPGTLLNGLGNPPLNLTKPHHKKHRHHKKKTNHKKHQGKKKRVHHPGRARRYR